MTNKEGIGLSDIGSSANLKIDSTADITSWKEKIDISIAKSRKIRGGNYIQIATVDPVTLEPRCRTVVFRGFLKTENNQNQIAMKMITDKRSNKFSEVTNSVRPIAEVVWWFAKSSEQYRIRGELKFIGVDEVDPSLITSRKEMWGNLSDPAREQFFWKDPGLPFESDSIVPVGGRDDEGKVLPPPDNFLMMLLIPQSCDYLRLGDNYRQMDLATNGVWSTKRVNP
jgi:pyridoxamine 5'-phosphate oxidase